MRPHQSIRSHVDAHPRGRVPPIVAVPARQAPNPTHPIPNRRRRSRQVQHPHSGLHPRHPIRPRLPPLPQQHRDPRYQPPKPRKPRTQPLQQPGQDLPEVREARRKDIPHRVPQQHRVLQLVPQLRSQHSRNQHEHHHVHRIRVDPVAHKRLMQHHPSAHRCQPHQQPERAQVPRPNRDKRIHNPRSRHAHLAAAQPKV